MLCEQCHGKRLVIVAGQVRPCEECGGMGLSHCCDGQQAQPEPLPASDLSYNDDSQEAAGRPDQVEMPKPARAPAVRGSAKPGRRPKIQKNR